MADNLVTTLKKQHQELQGILAGVKKKFNGSAPDGPEILSRLANFKQALGKHLKLENDTFYPELLEKIKARGLDVASIEIFIAEMKKLEKEISDFLKKYNSPKAIRNDPGRFRSEFDFITSSMIMRITSEEDGVFLYW